MNDVAYSSPKSKGRGLRVVIGETNADEAQRVRASLALHYPGLMAITALTEQTFRQALAAEPCDLVVVAASLLSALPSSMYPQHGSDTPRGPMIVTARPEERASLLALAGEEGLFPLLKSEGYAEILPHLARNALGAAQKADNARYARDLLPLPDNQSGELTEHGEATAIVAEGLIVAANRALLKLLALPDGEVLLGTPLLRFLDDGESHQAAALLAPQGIRSRRLLLRDEQGRGRWATVWSRAVRFRERPALKLFFTPLALDDGFDEPTHSNQGRLDQALDVAAQWPNARVAPEILAPQILSTFARALGVEGGSFYLRRDNCLELIDTIEERHQPARIDWPLAKGSVLARALEAPRPRLRGQYEPRPKAQLERLPRPGALDRQAAGRAGKPLGPDLAAQQERAALPGLGRHDGAIIGQQRRRPLARPTGPHPPQPGSGRTLAMGRMRPRRLRAVDAGQAGARQRPPARSLGL